MIIYSKLEINRIKDFWELLNRLDTETDYMMYEPNERKAKTTIQELKLDIQDNVILKCSPFVRQCGIIEIYQ